MRIKKRHKIVSGIVIVLIVLLVFLNLFPVGDGYWNQKQIDKINNEKNSDNFCFAVMGDTHQGFSTFDRIISDINIRKPIFVLDNGDLVSEGSKDKYRIFYKKMQESSVPFLVSIGNHDVRNKGRANYYNIFGDFYYSFSYNNSLFIVLDDANQDTISRQQMEFLESELKRDFKHKFIFLHVPVFNPRAYSVHINKNYVTEDMRFEPYLPDKKIRDEFNSLAEKYNVTIVFSSHIHGYFNETINGTSNIITGGSGGTLFGLDPEHFFYHYILVCVNDSSVNYDVIKFKSYDANTFERVLYAFWTYIYSFVYVNFFDIVIFIIIFILAVDVFYEEIIRVKTIVFRHKRVKLRI